MPENISSIGSGLSGLAKRDVALPAGTGVESDWHSGSTLESYVLPSNLRMDAKDTNLALSGIEVIKVSKNGKQQTRRLGISPNHRSILITSNRPQGKVLGLLKNYNAAADGTIAGAGAASPAAKVPMNELDLSMIVRLQLGQQSRRFFKARAKSNNVKESVSHPQSLSIVYRRPNNASAVAAVGSAVKDSLAKIPISPSGTNQVRMDAGEDSLDLIIPSKKDFDALLRTLEDLLAFYKEDEPYSNLDLAFLQFHLVDMGKSLGKDVKVSCNEWVSLCKRFNAPVSKSDATNLYRKLSPEAEGLDTYGVLVLMNMLKATSYKSSDDPRKRLFQKMAISKTEGVQRRIASSPTTPSGAFVKGFGDGDAEDSSNGRLAFLSATENKSQVVSARAFLDFLHEIQNETDMTIDDVHDLFFQLNGHRLSKDLEDTMSLVSGMKSAPHGVSWEKEYITWEVFTKYLMLESNDVFNPERAKPSASVMTEPLNNYWINTSHDTYLRRTKESLHDPKIAEKTDLQSYTLALYRGARAIELDVWDGEKGSNHPVVRYGETVFPDNTIIDSTTQKATRVVSSLKFSDVLRTVAYFLQSEPKSFPVILLIENHCSLPFQEIMAKNIEFILGKQGLLYRPDPNLTPTSVMPSPADLVGKVVIKSKRAMSGETTVLNNDFDDENRTAVAPESEGYDSEDDIGNNVVAFTSSGSIKSSEAKNNATYAQLFKTAKHDAAEAIAAVKSLAIQYDDAKKRATQARNHANALLRDVGMSYDELKTKRANGSDHVAEEGTEIVFDGEVAFDEDMVVVKYAENKAVEIAAAFAECVEESRLVYSAASAEARSETELFEIAQQDLAEQEMILAEAKEALEEVSNRNRRLKEAAERALAEARSSREYADNAERRVAAVRALLDKSHNQAVSSETVAGTADAEAKISEERACDAEARAQKARAKADKEKEKANEESRKEDALEEELASSQKKRSELVEAINRAQDRADDAVAMSEKLTDEIREVKSGSFDGDANKVAERKLKERSSFIKKMDIALAEKLTLETKLRKLENKIEDLRRKTKLQEKIAASAHRQADHFVSIADQLEDHALEEREAANLRNTACAKAKQSVENSDAVVISTEAQLAEAERAAKEAREHAIASREKAEQLAKDAEGVQDTSSLEEDVTNAQIDCDAFQSSYDLAKESKEEAVWRAAEARLAHEKNCLNLASLERDAMAELLHQESVQQAELLAANACENAEALAGIVKSLEDKQNEAEAVAAEKAGALAIATRFKEKKRRNQTISQSLSKLTLLHSSNYRTWIKSMKTPTWTMHSFPAHRIVKMAEEGKEQWKNMIEFNRNHFSRAYPPSSSLNYNPLLPWAMGCQFASLNFARNKFMLVNDGRFRENGNTGYVLKPEYLCSDSLGALDDALDCPRPKKVTIRIISGFCLPKSMDSKPGIQKRTINPFVVVTMYDGSPASLLPPPSYSTCVVKGNGLNPIWNENEAASFTCLDPDLGVISFAVYDHDDVAKKDLFIGGAAMPVRCMRGGYRCVSLFDSNNSRSGAMKFSSLFVKVKLM